MCRDLGTECVTYKTQCHEKLCGDKLEDRAIVFEVFYCGDTDRGYQLSKRSFNTRETFRHVKCRRAFGVRTCRGYSLLLRLQT